MPRVSFSMQPELPFEGDAAPAPLDNTADFRGTVCQREIVKLFEGRARAAMSRAILHRKMVELGHAESTVERSIAALVSYGTIEPTALGLQLTDRPLPPVKKKT